MHNLKERESKGRVAADRRSGRRVSVSLDTRLFLGNMFYAGNVLNISELGMFINTNICIPSDALCVVLIKADNKVMKIVAKVKRVVGNSRYSLGIGLKLINPPERYKDFVMREREVLRG